MELILEISKLTKNINYHIYGDLKLANKNLKFRSLDNIKFFNHVDYFKIPKLMSKYNVLLMPYSKNVTVRSNNIDAGKYMSPLKLFEYLAMSKIIIASKLKVYSHILINNKNSILINSNKQKLWASNIEFIFKNLKKYNFLKKSALQVSKKFTWEKRVEIILSSNNKFKN